MISDRVYKIFVRDYIIVSLSFQLGREAGNVFIVSFYLSHVEIECHSRLQRRYVTASDIGASVDTFFCIFIILV